MTAKRTPLCHAFLARNAQMVEKAHFLSANVFTDAKTEHHAVRNAAGLFEIFGQFLVEGLCCTNQLRVGISLSPDRPIPRRS